MKLITNEYTVLINKSGNDVTIRPNTPFDPINGDFVVSASAIIRNNATGDIVEVLQPGQTIKGVGASLLKETPKSSSTAKPKQTRKTKKVSSDLGE